MKSFIISSGLIGAMLLVLSIMFGSVGVASANSDPEGECWPNVRPLNLDVVNDENGSSGSVQEIAVGTRVKLSWDAPDCITPEDVHYTVHRDVMSEQGGFKVLTGNDGTTNTYFTDTARTLDFGEKFRYMVRYMGGNGAIITVSSPRPIPERPISTTSTGALITGLNIPAYSGNPKTWKKAVVRSFRNVQSNNSATCDDGNGGTIACNCSSTRPDLGYRSNTFGYVISTENRYIFDEHYSMTNRTDRQLWKGYTMHQHKWYSPSIYYTRTPSYPISVNAVVVYDANEFPYRDDNGDGVYDAGDTKLYGKVVCSLSGHTEVFP